MTCEEYEALLMQTMEGDLSPEDAARLRAHESTCGACAQRRRDMETLLADLSDLKEEELPLPEDFHQGWTTMVEEEASKMKQEQNVSTNKRHNGRRILAAAAAAVVLIGGTLLTRDALNTTSPQLKQSAVAPLSTASRSAANYGMVGTENETSGYDDSYDYAAYDSGMSNGVMLSGSVAQQDAQTKVIRTASLTLGTQQFEEDLAQLQRLCEENGGWISYSSQSGEAERASRSASLTLRIPTDKLDALLEGAGSVGRVIRRTETAEDVTDSYQDTAARLATQQAKMERLQALMSDTASLSDVLELESAIADTQYTIDSLQGQLNYTDSQVNYATVDVTLREESAADAATRDMSLGERLLTGLQTGWETFRDFIKDMLVFLSAALPYLATLAVVGIIIRLIYRKKRGK